MERKLVSIQRIESLEPIVGADQIVKARVMGWDVVVKKAEFAVGDPCVFFEIDSVLPDGAPWAEFMRPRGFRVKTARLRGVLSQGLALPVAILPADAARPAPDVDLRDLLGVTKYEPELPDSREVAGPFPGAVPKTDEIRLQSALGVLDELRGQPFYVTTKCDGTSATYYRAPDGAFTACSRNWALAPGPNPVWRAAERHRLADALPPGFAIQGELCGPGIQRNRLGLTELALFVFSVHDVRAGRRLDHGELVAFADAHGLATVPIEEVVTGEPAASYPHSLEHWLERARGLYAGTTNRKEGIVVRPLTETLSPTLGGRLSFKVINNDFLLKDEA
ncbi:MAG: RNA ligase (ATP) [Myxococcales bacterium]|nr:RNA ligase (ATP) [Myxococcales bacterium]